MDLNSVMKAFQAISGQIVLERLLRTLMEVVIENGGAEKGCLVVPKGGEWVVEAEGASDGETRLGSPPTDVEESDAACAAVVRQVARSCESVVVADAAGNGPFVEDAYVKRHRTKSVLCMPLLNQGRLGGVLYLENNSVADVFTRERVEMLGLLAGQAAVSLEHARMYQEARREIEEQRAVEAALRESEERFRAILDSINDAIFVHDLTTGEILDVNHSMTTMWACTREEALRARIEDLSSGEAPYTQKEALAWMKKAAEGEPQIFEWRAKDMKGRRFWAEVSMRRADIGGRARLLVVSRDVTERKMAEDALRESMKRLRTVVTGAPIVLYSFDRHGVFTLSEGKGLTGLGLKPGEIVGKTVFEIYGGLAEPFTALRRAMAGETFVVELSFPAGGTFEASHTAMRDAKGEYDGTIGVLVDITDRKRAEAALKESEERYRNFIRHATEGIYRIDFLPPVPLDLPEEELVDRLGQNAIVGEVNEHLARMYGLFASEMVGRRATDFAPDYGKRALLAVRAPNFQVREQETQDVDPTGRSVFLQENFTGVAEGGHLVHIWGMQRDTTERKRAEEEKEKLQAQLAQAQKMESVGRLAGGVAHDFNNMLQSILGNAVLALMALPPESALRESLEEIQKTAQRSADLTRQLLAFARKQTIAPKVLDLNEAVAGTLKMLSRLIGEDIELAWLPGAKLGLANVDPSQVDQILTNLCVNARDAIGGDGGGKITIETANAAFDEAYVADHPEARSGEYVRLAVSDNGCGMGPEVRAHLFEPFYTSKGLGQGTGLGLATVYGIVKQNNGFITVYSEPGRGTTLQVHLPRYVAPAAAAPQESPTPAPARGNETILLVEDEPSILRVSQRLLEHLGYRVLVASTPGEAIRLAREHVGEIHLLVTDVVMPEMNGRDLARNLLSHHPNLKRLFMSGYTANVIAHHGVLDPGVHFLQKPYSVQTLAEKVRQALSWE